MDSGSNPPGGAGFTAFDMLALPDDQRRLVRLVLHHGHLSYAGLCHAVESLPRGEGLSRDDLDTLLLQLLGIGWLVVVDSSEELVYRVHLRAAADRAARPRSGMRDRVRRLWDALEDDGHRP